MRYRSHIGVAMQLDNLSAHIAAICPGLHGCHHTDAHTTLVVGSDTAPAAIARLHGQLQNRYPQAGALFWVCRTWSLLVWQPIYLSILAVHLLGKAPCLHQLGLHLDYASVRAYALAPYPLWSGKEAALVAFSGRQIARCCQLLYQHLLCLAPLSLKMAQKLQADCMMSALLLQNRHRPRMRQPQFEACASQWLAAAGLPPYPSTLTLAGGNPCLNFGLRRQACCQEFRVDASQLCVSCPRIPLSQRIAQMNSSESQSCC